MKTFSMHVFCHWVTYSVLGFSLGDNISVLCHFMGSKYVDMILKYILELIGEVALKGKVPVAKTTDLSSVARTHLVKGEN